MKLHRKSNENKYMQDTKGIISFILQPSFLFYLIMHVTLQKMQHSSAIFLLIIEKEDRALDVSHNKRYGFEMQSVVLLFY